jgi:TPR repeat protein
MTSSAYELLDAGKYDEAARRFGELAAAGDASANLHLGWMAQKGLGSQADLAKAEQLYLRAHAQGASDAAYYLGTLYRSMNRARDALRYLEEAASKGHPSATYWAYVMYQDGEGISRDEDRAARLLQRAAELGHIFARRDLAKRMILGKLGIGKIPSGLYSFIANVFQSARLASSNPEDVRLR